MAKLIEPGNAMPLGKSPAANSTRSREDMIIDKTKTLSFPEGEILNLENFGTRGAYNTVAAMETECGKTLQESYRSQFPESAKYTDKVADR
jgi:hypothetical protein